MDDTSVIHHAASQACGFDGLASGMRSMVAMIAPIHFGGRISGRSQARSISFSRLRVAA
jgi:hypothetical protein